MSTPLVAKHKSSTPNYHIFDVQNEKGSTDRIYLPREIFNGRMPSAFNMYANTGFPDANPTPITTPAIDTRGRDWLIYTVPGDTLRQLVKEAVQDVPILVHANCSCGKTTKRKTRRTK